MKKQGKLLTYRPLWRILKEQVVGHKELECKRPLEVDAYANPALAPMGVSPIAQSVVKFKIRLVQQLFLKQLKVIDVN